jgi:predicted ATPase/transcriptional regulator with XRE-family HTH domain
MQNRPPAEHSFGAWVRRRRKALDLTQQELAQKVGCSHSLIFKIESDERRPSRQIAELLAQYLEIPPGERDLFQKVARQEKALVGLESLHAPPAIHKPVELPTPRAGNVPTSPTTLIGREYEIAMIGRQLLDRSCRMLTLTGPGGIGKTRLALEVARKFESHFADGVFFISMAGIERTESIIPAIADVLGLAFSGPADHVVQISNFLQTKEILLVVDNMEHVLESGSLLGEILRQTQQTKMLVTSRESLRMQWEWLFEVQGLPVPEGGDANLEENSAAVLFIQRARQASQHFSWELEDSEAIVLICKLVGGLPLAIELAASWVRVLSCREIAQELERGMDLLESNKVDLPLRHRSIKTVFDHSWTLLTEQERALLMKLSIFQGGFTREAAIAITGASLSTLSSLVDKSLLRHGKNLDHYDLHELVRQYAFARLQSNPTEESRTAEKHAIYYSKWIAALEGPIKSARQLRTSQLIRGETGNWHSAWLWAAGRGREDLLRTMIPSLYWYFEVHGYYAEALSVSKAAVDGFRTHPWPGSSRNAQDRSAGALFVNSLGWFEFRTGNVEKAISLFAESLELAAEADDPEVMYYIFVNQGYLSLFTGNVAEAERLTTEGLRHARRLNSAWHTAVAISILGIVAYQQGRLNEAYQQLSESLKIWRTVGDPRGLVFCMLYLGLTTLALNDIPATRAILLESNAIAEAKMDRWALAFGLDLLGMIPLSQGQAEEALAYFNQSLALSRGIGDQLSAAQTTIHLGQAYAALRSVELAKRLLFEAYANAYEAKWAFILLDALFSFAEIENGLSVETRLAVALSVLSHPAVTPHLRARSERMRDEIAASLTPTQIERATWLSTEKKPEAWAQELLR